METLTKLKARTPLGRKALDIRARLPAMNMTGASFERFPRLTPVLAGTTPLCTDGADECKLGRTSRADALHRAYWKQCIMHA